MTVSLSLSQSIFLSLTLSFHAFRHLCAWKSDELMDWARNKTSRRRNSGKRQDTVNIIFIVLPPRHLGRCHLYVSVFAVLWKTVFDANVCFKQGQVGFFSSFGRSHLLLRWTLYTFPHS
jgi:hypothetical protein